MDSFRPGSSSYCPFQNQEQEHSIIENRINDASEAHAEADVNINAGLSENHTIVEDHDNITDDSEDERGSDSSDEVENREEENRRQLYLPSGRPRPFYRVYSSSPQTSLLEDAGAIQPQPRTSSSNNKVCIALMKYIMGNILP